MKADLRSIAVDCKSCITDLKNLTAKSMSGNADLKRGIVDWKS